MKNIRFEGIEEIQEKIEEIGNTDKIKAALQDACAMVEEDAKREAPKDTGELRRSITSRVVNTGSEMYGEVYTPLEYAPYVEYGTGLFAEAGGRSDVPWHYKDEKGEWHKTSGQKPQPFMRPALDKNREEIIDLLQEGLKVD